jgi:hypothetical protein
MLIYGPRMQIAQQQQQLEQKIQFPSTSRKSFSWHQKKLHYSSPTHHAEGLVDPNFQSPIVESPRDLPYGDINLHTFIVKDRKNSITTHLGQNKGQQVPQHDVPKPQVPQELAKVDILPIIYIFSCRFVYRHKPCSPQKVELVEMARPLKKTCPLSAF